MSESNRSLRVKAVVGEDTSINVNINQDIDILEVLSLKINATNMYKLHQSNYGVIAGRVLANNSVGVPNVKVSVFIKADEEWINDSIFNELYPYYDVKVKNSENKRYNLLPEYQVSECYTPVGTFPSKRMVLDDDNIIEVYDRFYKYTTKTNNAGDYMIFGVPIGTQQIHVDVDLSDIGFLSQKPRDLISNGYNANQFENANKFKSSSNLDYLPQIISQDDSVYVYPLWGEEGDGLGDIKITRKDVYLSYEFKTYCVFMGSIIVDDNSNGVSRKCIPTERMGKMDKLTTGSGTIEMIRKKPDGNVEEFQIQGTQLIDEDGTWCYQIPMNLDYVKSDEYGNLVPTDDPNNGIPTRTRVRFRVSLNDFESDSGDNHLAKVLVPNNPKTDELTDEDGNTITDFEPDYSFGSAARDDEYGTKSFRDLFWNNVYTVKQYIPRIQKGNVQWNKKFTGIKGTNINGNNNSIPYNNMRVHLTFMFVLQCAILKALIWIIKITNSKLLPFIIAVRKSVRILFTLGIGAKNKNLKCYYLGDGICPDLEGWYFAPGCGEGNELLKNTWDYIHNDDNSSIGDNTSIDSKNSDNDDVECLTNNVKYLLQCIEINLAQEYEVIKFDFYNDWLNGMLYIPRWFAKYRKKKHRIFGSGYKYKEATLLACKTENSLHRRLTQQCALEYQYDTETNSITNVTSKIGCKNDSKMKCHRAKGRKNVTVLKVTDGIGQGGLLKIRDTLSGKKVYYFKPCEWFKRGKDYIKINMFATDIVLLGSLNDCDKHGIPQAFRYLKSSTYFMPSNLASTNMDETGNMYMVGGTSICNNTRTTQEISVSTAITFDEYNKWSRKKDFYETPPQDVTEYAVTESAGIDWGYIGPNQWAASTAEDKLYNPGGHFLGISCVKPEVNIKSCVNLSRICEIGVSQSSRNYVVTKNGDEFKYTYIYPNGLISKDELNDNDIRSMFATMNQNGLKTKYDSTTNYLIYDFVSMRPTNFNGEFKNRIENNVNYNNTSFRLDDQAGTVDSSTKCYTRSNEWTSIDYYNFRLGFNGSEDKAKQSTHFLKKNGDTYAVPRYENSFYFYFGLKDGNTALDKFFNDFYAPCEILDEDYEAYKITTTAAEYCNHYTGTLTVEFNNVEGPYKIRIKRNNKTYYFYEEELIDNQYKIILDDEIWYKHYNDDGYYYSQDPNIIDENGDIKVVLSDFYETVDTRIIIYNIEGNENTVESTYTATLSSYDGTAKDINFVIPIDTVTLSDALNIDVTNFSKEVNQEETVRWSILRENDFDIENAINDPVGQKLENDDGLLDITIDAFDLDEEAKNGKIIGVIVANSEYYSGFVYKNYIQNTSLIDAVKEQFDNSTWIDVDSFNAINDISDDSSKYEFIVPVWKGNDDYSIFEIITCGGDTYSFINATEVNVSMPIDLDIYFYDSDFLYNKKIKPIIGKNLAICKNSKSAVEHTSALDSKTYSYIDIRTEYPRESLSWNWWDCFFQCYYFSNNWEEWTETAYLCKHIYIEKLDEKPEEGIEGSDYIKIDKGDGTYEYYIGEHVLPSEYLTDGSFPSYRLWGVDIEHTYKLDNNYYYYKFHTKEEVDKLGLEVLISISPKQFWSLKKALFFTNSIYQFTTENQISVGLTGGSGPYTEYIAGTPERITEYQTSTESDRINNFEFIDLLRPKTGVTTAVFVETNEIYKQTVNIDNKFQGVDDMSKETDEVYSISKDELYLPTFGVVLDNVTYDNKYLNYTNYSFSINGESTPNSEYYLAKDTDYFTYDWRSPGHDTHTISKGFKGSYLFYGKDINNDLIPKGTLTDTSDLRYIDLPSIYRPFYFNSLCFINSGNDMYFNTVIFNGITYKKQFNSVKYKINHSSYIELCDEIPDAEDIWMEDFKPNFNLGYYHPNSAITVFKNDFSIDGGHYESLKDLGSTANPGYYNYNLIRTAFDYESINNNKQHEHQEGYRSFGRKWEVENSEEHSYTSNNGLITFEFSVTEGSSDEFKGSDVLKTISESFVDIQFPFENEDGDLLTPNTNIVFVMSGIINGDGEDENVCRLIDERKTRLNTSYCDYADSQNAGSNIQYFRGLFGLNSGGTKEDANKDLSFTMSDIYEEYRNTTQRDKAMTALNNILTIGHTPIDGTRGGNKPIYARYIYAVYDSYTKSDNGYTFDSEKINEGIYKSIPKHTPIMSIVKEYTYTQFTTLMKKYLEQL